MTSAGTMSTQTSSSPGSAMSEIAITGLTFGYLENSKHRVVRDVSATFPSHQITVLTGPSGCGKSTLLYLAAGIYPQNAGFIESGTVKIDGVDPATLPPYARCKVVGLLFQNPDLQFCMDTVRNELIFCLENIKAPPEEFEARIDEALAFCEIEHLKGRTLSSLSGGEKQKAMLACLVALRPQWLLLDEPFANIDDDTAHTIALKIKDMQREFGTGVLAIDHRLHNWAGIADTLYLFEGAGALMGPTPFSQLDAGLLAQAGVSAPGQRYQLEKPQKAEAASPTLTLSGLTLGYEGQPVLSDLSAQFYPGQIYAIVGGSGSGKTTLFGILSGLKRCPGQVLLEGDDLLRHRKRHLGQIGFVTQSPQDQFVTNSVLEEITLSLRARKDAVDVMARAEEILRHIDLWRYRQLSPYMLSQGQQRRLGVAALLAYDCQVLVCDEPTYAQDRKNTLAIMEELQRQVLKRGLCLILSTHDGQLARDYADYILDLKGGKLVARAQSCL